MAYPINIEGKLINSIPRYSQAGMIFDAVYSNLKAAKDHLSNDKILLGRYILIDYNRDAGFKTNFDIDKGNELIDNNDAYGNHGKVFQKVYNNGEIDLKSITRIFVPMLGEESLKIYTTENDSDINKVSLLNNRYKTPDYGIKDNLRKKDLLKFSNSLISKSSMLLANGSESETTQYYQRWESPQQITSPKSDDLYLYYERNNGKYVPTADTEVKDKTYYSYYTKCSKTEIEGVEGFSWAQNSTYYYKNDDPNVKVSVGVTAPIFGTLTQKFYNLLYGDENSVNQAGDGVTFNNGLFFERLTTIDYNYSDGTKRMSLFKDGDLKNGLVLQSDFQSLNTVAGCINTLQDLIGHNIESISSISASTPQSGSINNKLYYSSDDINKKLYYKVASDKDGYYYYKELGINAYTIFDLLIEGNRMLYGYDKNNDSNALFYIINKFGSKLYDTYTATDLSYDSQWKISAECSFNNRDSNYTLDLNLEKKNESRSLFSFHLPTLTLSESNRLTLSLKNEQVYVHATSKQNGIKHYYKKDVNNQYIEATDEVNNIARVNLYDDNYYIKKEDVVQIGSSIDLSKFLQLSDNYSNINSTQPNNSISISSAIKWLDNNKLTKNDKLKYDLSENKLSAPTIEADIIGTETTKLYGDGSHLTNINAALALQSNDQQIYDTEYYLIGAKDNNTLTKAQKLYYKNNTLHASKFVGDGSELTVKVNILDKSLSEIITQLNNNSLFLSSFSQFGYYKTSTDIGDIILSMATIGEHFILLKIKYPSTPLGAGVPVTTPSFTLDPGFYRSNFKSIFFNNTGTLLYAPHKDWKFREKCQFSQKQPNSLTAELEFSFLQIIKDEQNSNEYDIDEIFSNTWLRCASQYSDMEIIYLFIK